MFKLERKQFVNSTIDEVWDFISNPHNLKEITPDYMNFKITSKNLKPKIFPGMIIKYKVAPILKIKMNWVTEITEVKDKKYFTDKQASGPYSFWEHQHILEKHKNGVMMHDIIKYKPPFGIIGRFLNFLFIKKDLKYIFDYRENILNKKYNQKL